MAKPRKRMTSSGWNRTASTIGSALGQVAARVDSWKKQRAEIVTEIQKLISSAEALLTDLGDAAAAAARRRKGGRPKGYKMSEETKRKLRAAWKRRKAAMAERPSS
jgi:ElaB/YqjD/DUF883 family membrane-anchored ribosome-binding protein